MERIAQIIGTLPGGGVKNVMFNYYRKIDKDKYQFDFYYDCKQDPMIPQELIDMGARFYQIPNHKNIFKCIKVLREYFRENKYNIVHSGMNTLSFISLYAAKKENVKIRICHNHSVPEGDEHFKNLVKNIFKYLSRRYCNVKFACSKKAGEWMFDKDDVFLLRNAIDFDRFKNVDKNEIEEIIHKYNLEGKFVIGNVGRLTYAKNHRFLIDVFKEYKKNNPNSVLLLVGDGELRQEIEDYIDKNNLNESVIITGNVNNPELYYHLMDISVIPSIFEGLSLAAIESQVTGIPTIISDRIPNEAIISSEGLCVLRIEDSLQVWVNKLEELKEKKIVLNEDSLLYDINREAKVLQEEYDVLLNANVV